MTLPLFDDAPVGLVHEESITYSLIRTATSAAPISLTHIATFLDLPQATEIERKTSERRVKAIVESLRRRGLPIGSSRRRGSSGYFLIASSQDVDRFLQAFMAQVIAEARTARAVAGSQRIKRILGQIAIDLEAA